MEDPKFVESELKVTASEELQEEVDKELDEESPEIAISSVLDNPNNKCCGGGCESSEDTGQP